MLVKQYLIDKTNQLGNDYEKIANIFSIVDEVNNQHLIFVKHVFDKTMFKLKAFIVSFNKGQMKVTQVELAKDLGIDKVLPLLAKENLLNADIQTTPDALLQDINYIYHLSKRYSLIERNHPILKEALLDTLPRKQQVLMEGVDDVLDRFLLNRLFPFHEQMGFVQSVQQLLKLPKNELKQLLHKQMEDIVPMKNTDFQKRFQQKLVKKDPSESHVQRIDISALSLFQDAVSMEAFLEMLQPIPYTTFTECHFHLDKEYLLQTLSPYISAMDEFLLNTYKETVFVEKDLRYVCFVEQLKEMQRLLKKMDSLKQMEFLYEKEKKEMQEKVMQLQADERHAFAIVEILKQVERNIAHLNVKYPATKLDGWLRMPERYMTDDFTINGILDHQEFFVFAEKYFALSKYKFLFKAVDVDYVVFRNGKDEIVLEIKTDEPGIYRLHHIYSNKTLLTDQEKNTIASFCMSNHIALTEKKHPYLR